jgi:hypothetical protein
MNLSEVSGSLPLYGMNTFAEILHPANFLAVNFLRSVQEARERVNI